MPITFDGTRAVLAGRCIAEEADALHEWLRTTRDAVADLSLCGEVHTALVQILLAARGPVQPPADPVLAACLVGAGLPGTATANVAPLSDLISAPQSRQAAEGRDRPVKGKNKKVS